MGRNQWAWWGAKASLLDSGAVGVCLEISAKKVLCFNPGLKYCVKPYV